MIIYVLIAAFVGGLALGGGGVWQWKDGQIARAEEAQRKAEAVVAAAAEEAEQEAANKIVDMTAAFDAGESNARTVTKTVYVKGQQIAATGPFVNPVCTAPADALGLLNAARSGADVRVAANTAAVDGSVPAAGPATGRQDGNPISGAATGRGAVPAVQPTPSGTSSGGQVSGTGASGVRAKPRPIQ